MHFAAHFRISVLFDRDGVTYTTNDSNHGRRLLAAGFFHFYLEAYTSVANEHSATGATAVAIEAKFSRRKFT